MKIAIGVEYNGTAYHGWQRQSSATSVQQCVETALSRVADSPITIACAGRTDSGVHATGQVAHFETAQSRSIKAWTMGTNRYLPHDIRVHWAQPVPDCFHARFTATARRYRYIIFNRPHHSAILSQGLDHCQRPLDVAAMREAAQYFIGEQDFGAIQAAACQSEHSVRNIHFLRVDKLLDYVVIDIQANAFLLHMVRNIVGLLKHIGLGLAEPSWAQEVLASRDRCKAPATAAARGLYLVRVAYPSRYDLPRHEVGPLFLDQRL